LFQPFKILRLVPNVQASADLMKMYDYLSVKINILLYKFYQVTFRMFFTFCISSLSDLGWISKYRWV